MTATTETPPSFRDDASTTEESYAPDALSKKATLVAMTIAVIAGGLATLVAWYAFKQTSLPAFSGSLVTRALATVATVVIVIVTAVLMVYWMLDQRTGRTRPRWRTWLSYAVAYLAPAGVITASLTIPLSATRMYLDGIAIDQGFRTQYLTRLTDSWHLSDMNYADLPAFYPAGWFWTGGRFANLLGLPGWEAFQPWSLVSLSMVACLLVPVWQRITGSLPVATAIALVSTCIMLVTSSEEPYAAIIALGAAAAAVIGRRGLSGDRFALAGITVFLGLSASMYTLFTAVIALSMLVLAGLLSLIFEKSWWPILRVIVAGVGSMAIAAIVWAPYILAVLSGEHRSGATANHYLPAAGAQLPFPMLATSIVGILCFIGLIYLIVRFLDPDVRALAVCLIAIYCWIIASMAMTLAGTTLLGFRLEVVVTLLLATAGVLGLADLRLAGIHRFYPAQFSERTSKLVTICLVAVLSVAGISYAQSIPTRNAELIDLAYTETDGYGERADRFPADASQYYPRINEELLAQGFVPNDTVVLTSEKDFMSYYPYRGFQAFTSHYANPLGEFDERNAYIEDIANRSWSDLADPAAFAAALDSASWAPPQVFIFRGQAAEGDAPQETSESSGQDFGSGWVYDLAEDIYPNNPNVRFVGVQFNPASFDSDTFRITEIGPFVVVTRVLS